VRPALHRAIAAGVPLWNAGDHAGCARAYARTARAHAAAEPLLAEALRACRGAPVDASRGSQGWILRRAFDAVLERGRRGRAYGGAGSGRAYMERAKATRAGYPALRLNRASKRPLEWYTLNDTVMGGQSSSSLRAGADGGMCFGGNISLDGGGFASARTLIDSSEGLGLGGARAVRLAVTGDGQAYKVGLRASDGFREPTWQAELRTVAGVVRTVVTLPLDEHTWHGAVMGRRVSLPQGRKVDFGAMRGVGLALSLKDVHGLPSNAKTFREGPFKLEVHSMEFV
jgi:NADH dehydrogenase [ubiquinone] 1 alpha subcomplex assembly factor 1